ncbi:MAG: hypothetical protein GEV13_22600 [Rhodospirillales bacterium]|nr:hypothetical protein [Rhodospirillales bacterium]
MADVVQSAFTRTIIEDVIAVYQRLDQDDTPRHRRDLVRTAFAAIEGLHWQLKQDVLLHAFDALSMHERAAMSEETYLVDDRGNVNVVPRFLPLPSAIRLVVQMVKRYRPAYQVDYGHQGWANLRSAVDIRNRLVHPKVIEDLVVSDREVEATLSGFYWVLALVIEVLRETNRDLEETREALKTVVGEMREKREGAKTVQIGHSPPDATE